MVAITSLALRFIAGLQLISQVGSLKFPNDIDGAPQIECNDGNVRIAIKTTNGVASRIFAKGHYNTMGCMFERTNSATISIGSCGMNRQRQLEPRGITNSVIVVVQLHPLFVTKVDRAYNVKCFYMEADKIVTNFLDVSMLSTQSITNGFPMPICVYELHADSPGGPSARYARVGDKVWHVWSCPSTTFGILVHSCLVTDGEGNEFRILDEKGCGVDRYVLRTPEYSPDLTKAQQETHVFKYADKTAMVFNCQIKLCTKAGGGCNGITPPLCPSLNETFANATNINATSFNITSLESGNVTVAGFVTPTPATGNFSLNISDHGLLKGNFSVHTNLSAEVNASGESILNQSISMLNISHTQSIAPETNLSHNTTFSPGFETTNLENHTMGVPVNRTTAVEGQEPVNTTSGNATNTAQTGPTEESQPTNNVTSSGVNVTQEGRSGHSIGTPPFAVNITRPGNESSNVSISQQSENGNVSLNGTAVNGTVNATNDVLEEAAPQFFFLNALDGRGRRNVFRNSQGRLRPGATELPEDEARQRQTDAESIPTHHERHIVGARLLDDSRNSDIETDVSQSMWVLEPEEGADGEGSTDNRHKYGRHHNSLNSILRASVSNDEDSTGYPEDEIRQIPIHPPNTVCVPSKIFWATLIPLILIMITTIAVIIVCVHRTKRSESSSVLVRNLFPHMYKRQ